MHVLKALGWHGFLQLDAKRCFFSGAEYAVKHSVVLLYPVWMQESAQLYMRKSGVEAALGYQDWPEMAKLVEQTLLESEQKKPREWMLWCGPMHERQVAPYWKVLWRLFTHLAPKDRLSVGHFTSMSTDAWEMRGEAPLPRWAEVLSQNAGMQAVVDHRSLHCAVPQAFLAYDTLFTSAYDGLFRPPVCAIIQADAAARSHSDKVDCGIEGRGKEGCEKEDYVRERRGKEDCVEERSEKEGEAKGLLKVGLQLLTVRKGEDGFAQSAEQAGEVWVSSIKRVVRPCE